MVKTVLLEKIAAQAGSLEHQFSKSFKLFALEDDFEKANAVFIKPNLTYPVYRKGVTTRKEFVESLVAALRKINTTTKIYIGEGEGGYNSFPMTEAMRNMGFHEIEKKYLNVAVVNISKTPTLTVELKAKGKPYLVDLPEFLLNEVAFSITCPVPKVHCMTKITLSFKNQWGCLPDSMRLKNHYVFDEIIGQICNKLNFRYAFLDGKYGLNNNGPMIGAPVEINWFAASNSLGAFDVIVSGIMGFNWKKIGHLKMADKYGFIPKRNAIKVIGNISSLRRNFILKRNPWNYPALAAFHSKNLTHLFYFSKYSQLLHNIMYTFRKKPIPYTLD
jgi:uncharacterized protein (DUF362 family)